MSAEERAEYWKAEHIAANDRILELETRLRDIGDIAHTHSTGPAEVDWLWRIHKLAYELL